MEVRDVRVGVPDGVVAVPVGVASDGTGGLVVVMVPIVVAVLMLVLDNCVMMDVLVRSAQ